MSNARCPCPPTRHTSTASSDKWCSLAHCMVCPWLYVHLKRSGPGPPAGHTSNQTCLRFTAIRHLNQRPLPVALPRTPPRAQAPPGPQSPALAKAQDWDWGQDRQGPRHGPKRRCAGVSGGAGSKTGGGECLAVRDAECLAVEGRWRIPDAPACAVPVGVHSVCKRLQTTRKKGGGVAQGLGI